MTTQTTSDNSQLLRRALKGNAAFSTTSGLLFTLASAQIAAFLEIDGTSVLGLIEGAPFILIIGLGLLGFAASLLFTATREEVNKMMAMGAVFGDLVWVAASFLILLTGTIAFSNAGNWAVLIVADIVLVFAGLQYLGIRRIRV